MLKITAILMFLSGISLGTCADSISIPRLLESQPQNFLHPDDAFEVLVTLSKQGQSQITFKIVKGYYLYKSKFSLKIEKTDEHLLVLNLPTGEMKNDPAFGEVEIYRTNVTFSPNVSSSSNERFQNVVISYQGCAEDGICYPPQNKSIILSSGPKEFLSDTEGILERVKDQNALIILLLFFGFGVLLSLTPCVLPMLPILSGILVGKTKENSKSNALSLSITYVLGMASTYSLLGIFVGFLGYRLQVAFQNPWIILGFASLFFVFGVAMFGLLSVQMPAVVSRVLEKFSRDRRAGTYSGVFVMGILSALIVGPCVAPPLAAALTMIGQTGSAAVGATSLFAMGLGMGLPLIGLGASASFFLPKAGPWMRQINEFFGFVFFAVGVWFLGRLVPSLVLIGCWLTLSTVFLYWLTYKVGAQKDFGFKNTRLFQVAIGGALIISLGLTSFSRGWLPIFGPFPKSDNAMFDVPYAPVIDVNDLRAKVTAIGKNEVAMLELYADWCIECTRLEKNVLSDPELLEELALLKLFRLDLTKNTQSNQQFLKEFGLFGPPALLFFNDGKEHSNARIVGFVEKKKILETIDYMREVK